MTRIGITILAIALSTGVLGQEAKQPKGAAMLEGTWLLTAVNGQTIPEASPPLTLTFSGGSYHQTLGKDVNERGTFKVDSSKKPMTIDLAITEGTDKGKTQLGIVEVSGDTLRASLDTPGAGQRPADLKSGSITFVGTKRKP